MEENDAYLQSRPLLHDHDSDWRSAAHDESVPVTSFAANMKTATKPLPNRYQTDTKPMEGFENQLPGASSTRHTFLAGGTHFSGLFRVGSVEGYVFFYVTDKYVIWLRSI